MLVTPGSERPRLMSPVAPYWYRLQLETKITKYYTEQKIYTSTKINTIYLVILHSFIYPGVVSAK